MGPQTIMQWEEGNSNNAIIIIIFRTGDVGLWEQESVLLKKLEMFSKENVSVLAYAENCRCKHCKQVKIYQNVKCLQVRCSNVILGHEIPLAELALKAIEV